MATRQDESSKQGKKRLRKLNLAAISISQQQCNERVWISEGGSNPSPSQNSAAQRIHSPPPPPSPNQVLNEPNKEGNGSEKRKRGPTRMRTLTLNASDRAEVEFNARGQPIGLHSEWLSSYLGALARDIVPVTCDDWRKVEDKMKDDLWKCVTARFKIDDSFKKLFVQVMGTRWREFKSRLIASIRDASKLPNKESVYVGLKPSSVISEEDWSNFIQKKLSEEFEEKSKKFKQIRAYNQTPHTMSRKGYARLEDEMRKESPNVEIRRDEVWCKAHTKKNGEVPTPYIAICMDKIKECNSSQTSHENSFSITEDALSKTLGPERNGRVRGLGFGVTPSRVGASIYNSKKVAVLENQVSTLTNTVTNLEKNMEKVLMQLSSKGKEMEKAPTLRTMGDMNNNMHSPHSQNGSSHFGGSTNLNARETHITVNAGRKCKLLNWQMIAVAEGEIASTNPNDLAHNIQLGNDVWKVWVLVSFDPKAPLWRPNSAISVIEDAVGSTVAWHKNLITFD